MWLQFTTIYYCAWVQTVNVIMLRAHNFIHSIQTYISRKDDWVVSFMKMDKVIKIPIIISDICPTHQTPFGLWQFILFFILLLSGWALRLPLQTGSHVSPWRRIMSQWAPPPPPSLSLIKTHILPTKEPSLCEPSISLPPYPCRCLVYNGRVQSISKPIYRE